jgi:sigma-B regulation protein RsbU (phosphoserine phosphatase)
MNAVDDDAEDLFEHAPCGYLSTLPDGTIVRVNATFLEWTGYSHEDLNGRRFADLLTPGGRIYHETHYAPLLRMQGFVREIAVEMLAADGQRLPVLVNSTLRMDASGAPIGVRTAVFTARDRRRYEEELLRAREESERSGVRARTLAKTLQASLIPPSAPVVPGLDVVSRYRPAGDGSEVGGDFYDIFETARGEWAVVLGDVCGKGAEAATVTALARYTVRAAAMRTRRPAAVLSTLNDALLQQGSDRFCTAVYARIRKATGSVCRVTVASGGHPPALLVTADGQVHDVGRPGDLLGVMPTVALYDTNVDLRTGDVLVLYTDGVTEARRGTEFYGDDALRRVVRGARGGDAEGIATAVLDDVMTFQSGVARDDIALVVVRLP